MSRVSTYLNFSRNTEEAFNFYKSVFSTEFEGEISRMGDVPSQDGQPPLEAADKNLVMHVMLPILGGHVLMGTDAPESMDFTLNFGNNVYINLEPDTRAETDKLFVRLSEDGIGALSVIDDAFYEAFNVFIGRFGLKFSHM